MSAAAAKSAASTSAAATTRPASGDALTLSPAEAAALIASDGSVTARWLSDKAAAGLIPHSRIGRRVRFTRADVEAIIAAGHRDGAQASAGRLRPTTRSQARRSP